jgi:beta-mannosidase
LKKLLSFLTILLFIYSYSQVIKRPLDKGWEFQSYDNEYGKLSAKVPGNVFTDLYDNGEILHPFLGYNEKDLQWISEKDWVYESEFELSSEELKHANSTLVFEGLDTYANVYLNGKLILETNNAFRTWRVDVKKYLKKSNSLKIIFKSPSKIEESKAQKNPYKLPEGNRIYTRKAQFQYGWDWGPKYNIMGIWRPIYLEFWDDVKIEDVYIRQLKLSFEKADLSIEFELKSQKKGIQNLAIFLNNEEIYSDTIKINNKSKSIQIPIQIQNPKLWWTHNLGEPYLYEFKVQIKDLKGNLIEEKIIKKGLRTIELVTEKDEIGESFYFKLNGVPVYMKGANYIPQNSFQNWVKKEDYDRLLLDAKRANMNMLRVWGGGIYEEDYFYEKCDEFGILVWQDFMFACAMYPGDEEFLENVKQEAIDNVKRLRNHASIALWCGNNESSEGWHRWGWQEGRSDKEKLDIWNDYQKLFNGILPEIVNEYTDIPYWESSPKFGRGDARYVSEGDAHDWWIWHDGHPFENLESKTPRFMSEFGFQGFPSLETMQFMQGKKELDFNSAEFKNHQKHRTGFETIRTYMERDFPVPTHEEEYAYVSQLVQAYGIGKGIEAQRRNNPKTMGSLYWQLNDVWPAVSWSSIDYFGNWKAMHYQAKKSFQNLIISFERKGDEVWVYLVNDEFSKIYGTLQLKIQNVDGEVLHTNDSNVHIDSNTSQIVLKLNINEFELRKNEIFIHAKFLDVENIFYFVSPKEMKLNQTPIQTYIYDTVDGSGYILILRSPTLHRFVEIQLGNDEEISDNYFDLIPNKDYVLFISSNKALDWSKPMKIKSLNDFVRVKNED